MLLASAILLAAFLSLKNVNSIYVPVAHPSRVGSRYNTQDNSILPQIRSSHAAVTEPLKSYTDDDVTNNPLVFKNVAEYELSEALNSEGIDPSKHVVESHSYTNYGKKVVNSRQCKTFNLYYYKKCTDPHKKQILFKQYKGPGYCPAQRTGRKLRQALLTHRLRYYTHSRTYYSHRRAYLTSHRTYSPHQRSHTTPMSPIRYVRRGHWTFTGWRYVKKEMIEICGPVNGRFLQQVVSDFVLKGKTARYQKLLNRTFKYIRRRY